MIKNDLNKFNVGIYCRLSREDENKLGDSSSIQNQKEILTEYVNKLNWNLVNVYIDDGFTGTDFNRPGFKQMLNDIELGLINCVVTKDLSRLGRNYIQTGQYLEEYFPEKGVRYIAVNDNYDSFTDNNELGPFKNIINEWYAKDISKKIRFSLNSMAQRGERRKTPVPLYGYQFDSNGNRYLDPNSSNVVQLIFNKYLELKSTYRVANFLNEQKIYSPRYYNHIKYNFWKNTYSEWPEEKKYVWTSSTIKAILRNREYLGDLITKRKELISYKIHKKRDVVNPVIVERKYPAIITKDIFDKVNTQLDVYINNSIRKEENVLQHLGVCGCCGKTLGLTYMRSTNKNKIYRYVCRNKACSNKAFITTTAMNKILLNEINSLINSILNEKEMFAQYVKDYIKRLNTNQNEIDISQNETTVKRISELKKYIEGAFKAKLEGDIDDEMYKNIVGGYKSELNTLEAKANTLKHEFKYINYDYEVDYFTKSLEALKVSNKIDPLLLGSICKKIYVTNERESGKLKRTIVDIDYGNLNPMIISFLGDNNE